MVDKIISKNDSPGHYFDYEGKRNWRKNSKTGKWERVAAGMGPGEGTPIIRPGLDSSGTERPKKELVKNKA